MKTANSVAQRIAIAVLVVGALACGEQRLPMTSRAELPLLNARPTNASEHPYAAFLNIDVGRTLHCTGTLIAPGIVLTASHCVRCVRSIEVTLLGGSPRTQTVMPNRIHAHPDSATSAIDCSHVPLNNDGDVTSYLDELNSKTIWGRDLAILELPQNSTATVMPPLLDPPYGFNPLRAFFGKSVTMVGRGNPTVECEAGTDTSSNCELNVMRTGVGSLDRYSPTLGLGRLAELSGIPEGPQLGPFLLNIDLTSDSYNNQPPEDQQSVILGGDSGGPMIATLSGQPRVIGVASAGLTIFGVPFKSGFHTPIFLARNASFIKGFLGRSTSILDTDGDDVEDRVDNCRNTYNPDQVDFDGDGVGFFCDNCEPELSNSFFSEGPARITEYDGKAASEFAQFANPEQEDCNSDAEDEQALARFPGAVNGLPRGITPQEYRQYFAGRGGDPVGNFYVDTLLALRRGDVCDPTPCARATAGTGLRNSLTRACPLFENCGALHVDSISFDPIRANGSEPAQTGTTGVRFCPCDHGENTEAGRRLKCGSASASSPCPIGAEHYSLNDPFWHTLSLNGQPPTTDVLTTSTFVPPGSPIVLRPLNVPNPNAVNWTAEADAQRLTGDPHARGVLWSHVVSFAGNSTTASEGAAGASLADLASNYSSPDLTPVNISPRLPRPDLPILACFPTCPPPWFLGERFCLMCGHGTWFLPDPELGFIGIFGRNGVDALDLTDRFSTVARDLLGSTLIAGSRRIMASETENRLIGARIDDRAIVLDASFRITGGLRTAGSLMDARLVNQIGANPLAAGVQQAALAFSATRSEIFALARLAASEQAQLFSQPTTGTGWEQVGIAGAALGGPKAMVYSERNSSLYVLNQQSAASALELLRIDLPTGTAIRLDAAIAPAASAVRTALSIASDGELFIATSTDNPPTTELRAFTVTGDKLTLTRRLTRAGELLGGDIATGTDDVSYVAQGAQGFVTHTAAHAAFESCTVGASNTVVCRPPLVKAQFNVTTDWGTGYCVELKLTNTGTKPTTDWSATFNVLGTTIYNIWNLNSTGSTGTIAVTPTADWNRVIAAGASSFSLGFCANRPSTGTALPTDLSAVGTF